MTDAQFHARTEDRSDLEATPEAAEPALDR